MANAIQIKRRRSNGDPGAPNASNLKWGELAFNEADNTLYYGYGSGDNQAVSVPSIGGSGAYSLRGGTNATGVWPISITGNAATVTSGVTYAGTPSAGYIPKFKDSDTIEDGYQISTNLSTHNSDSFIPRADAVKIYVDSVKQGLDIKDSVRVATVAPIDPIYAIYDSGVTPNQIRKNAVGALSSIDGVTLKVGDRILVKNEPNPLSHGIYKVTELGGVSSPWLLERSDDANSSEKITPGMFTFVETGSTLADTGWVLTSDNLILNHPISGTITFSQFSAAGQIYDGSGLYKQGNTIGVGQGAGITVSANAVAVNAGSGLTADANGVHIDGTVVRTTGDQVVSGVKEFASANNTNLNLSVNEAGGNSFINFRENDVNKVFIGFNGSDDSLNINSVANGFTSRLKINTLTNLIASGTSSPASHVPIFISDPSTSSQVLCHKSKSDFVTDLGILSNSDTSLVRTTGDQTVSGIKTFENTAIFNSGIELTAATVTQCDYIAVWNGAADPSASPQSIQNISVSQFLTDLNLNNVDNTSLSTWPGSTNITTLGTISSGTWSADTIAVNKGGTGQTSYTNGQLLIGNNTGNTLTKATLTSGNAIDIVNGNGSITISHADTSNLSGAQGSDGIASITLNHLML